MASHLHDESVTNKFNPVDLRFGTEPILLTTHIHINCFVFHSFAEELDDDILNDLALDAMNEGEVSDRHPYVVSSK